MVLAPLDQLVVLGLLPAEVRRHEHHQQRGPSCYDGAVGDLGDFVAAVTLEAATAAVLCKGALPDTRLSTPLTPVADHGDYLKDRAEREKLRCEDHHQRRRLVLPVQILPRRGPKHVDGRVDIMLAVGVVLEGRATQYVVYQRLLLCLSFRHVLFEQRQFVQRVEDARGDLDVILVGLLGDIGGEDAREALVFSLATHFRVFEEVAAL